MKQLFAVLIFFFASGTLIAQDKASFVEGGLSAISSYRKLRDDGSSSAQSMINLRDAKEHPIPSWGVFVNYRRQLTNRFILNAGLVYERLGYGHELTVRYSDQDFPNGGPVPGNLPYEIKYQEIYHVLRIPVTLEYYFSKRKRFEW